MEEYYPIAEKYKTPIVVTGFEPLDLLQGILMTVMQLEKEEYKVENQYARSVQREGNRLAKDSIGKVFTISDRQWRGIGSIPQSGYEVNERYKKYNARLKFDLNILWLKKTKPVSAEILCVASATRKTPPTRP